MKTVGWDNRPTVLEKIVLIAYGQDIKVLKELMEACVDFSVEEDKGLLNIYQVEGWCQVWTKIQSKKARPIDSVVLDQDICS